MKKLIGALALAALLVGAACSASQGDDQSLPASGQAAHASQPVQTATPASIAPTAMPAAPLTTAGDVRVVSVTRVIDGDTVEVRRPDGIVDRVRLVGVDAPETASPNRPGEYGNITDVACLDRWGDRATSYLKDKLEGRAATLEPDPREGPRDSFGRFLAYVVHGGEDINARLVELGYARVYTEGRAEREDHYLALQRAAQKASAGLWGCSVQGQAQRQAPSSPLPATSSPAAPSPAVPLPAASSPAKPSPAAPPPGAGRVVIECIFYDGLVPRTEADEYVQVLNAGDSAVDLIGWVLRDISDGAPSFRFPGYILQPGARVRVYTNQVHPESGGFSFRRGTAVWNNSAPDVAALYNADGVLVLQKSYPPGCS